MELDSVSAATLQAEAATYRRIIRWLVIGWALSVVALGSVTLAVTL